MKRSFAIIAATIAVFTAVLTGCTDEPYYQRLYNVYYLADTSGTSIPASAVTYRAIKKSMDTLATSLQYYVSGAWYETELKSDYAADKAEEKMDADAKLKFAEYGIAYEKNIHKLDSMFRKKLDDNAAALEKENATVSYSCKYYLVKVSDTDSVKVVSSTVPYVIEN